MIEDMFVLGLGGVWVPPRQHNFIFLNLWSKILPAYFILSISVHKISVKFSSMLTSTHERFLHIIWKKKKLCSDRELLEILFQGNIFVWKFSFYTIGPTGEMPCHDQRVWACDSPFINLFLNFHPFLYRSLPFINGFVPLIVFIQVKN